MRAWCLAVVIAGSMLSAAQPARAQATDPGLSPAVAAAVRNEQGARPRLVVLISIDQFRADYLTRLHDLFGTGGFKRLTGEGGGAWFTNAHHSHYPLKTSPGHTVMLTGGAPYKTGIIGNGWWDPVARQSVESIDQPNAAIVGADPASKEKPAGPVNLRCTTVGDELKLATAGRAKVVSLSLKNTAAILMGGHAADACIWFDDAGGRWISSTAYCRPPGTHSALPAWVTTLNDERIPAKSLGTTWECALSPQTLKERTAVSQRVCQSLPKGFGSSFPHSIGAEDKAENYSAFTYTPAANAFIFQTAQHAVTAEKLGQRRDEKGGEVPDLLALSLSSNDIVGHAFGPYSPQAVDMMVRTDAMLADFLTFLDNTVGKGKYLVALTGDHGVATVPEDAAAPLVGTPAVRFRPATVVSFISDVLTARYGEPAGGGGLWFSTYENPKRRLTSNGGIWVDGGIYLSREATDALLRTGKIASLRDVEQLVCDAVNGAGIPGIYGCYGKRQILEGRIADNDIRRHLSLGVHPQLSPDLFILEDQLCLPGEGNTSITNHGTPYAYDTNVPIILYQPGLIKPGTFTQRVSTMDIAPTISLLIGVQPPSACDGNPLAPALAK